MTRVSYDQAEMRMEIRGHAGGGEYGRDLICAAESILLLTLEAALEDSGELLLPTVRKRPGEAMIRCEPEAGHERKCREIMHTVFIGFQLLANRYPENVSAEAINADWREI